MSEFIFTVSAGEQAAVTVTDVITHRNVAFILDRPMPLVRSCLGEPAVISTKAFNIIAISPASTQITGAKGAFVAHGTMLNPDDLSTNNAQGFDELLGKNDGGGQSASQTPYVSAINADPAINGPISVAQGVTGSVVKSVRVSGVTETSGDWQTIDGYVVLSVLDTVPEAGFFRPGMAPGVKTIYGKESDINYDIFRTLPTPPGLPDLTSAEGSIAETYPYFGLSNQEKMRRFDVQGGNNYSVTYSSNRADSHALLHTNLTNAQKRLMTLRSIQHGIDLAQAQANGYVGDGGAGQNYGRPFFSYLAAFALDSAPLLTAAQALSSGALNQHFWAVSAELEREVEWPATGGGENFRHNSPLLQSDLNIPEWDREPGDPTRRDATPSARYRQFWPVGMMEALNIALLQNGPGGISGAQAILNGGPFDATNPAAAALAYYDRNRNWPVEFGNLAETGESDDRFARWDAWRPLFGITPWTGRPDWVTGNGQATAGDGQIIYDWSQHNWATEPIIRRDLRISLDGLQWVEQQDIPASGVISGATRGVEHQVGFRLVSASGPGRWSPTYPGQGASGANPNPRNTVIPTGTQSTTPPVNTSGPRMLVREVENWPGSDMVYAGTAFTSAQLDAGVVLYAGLGYWTGFPGPVFSYQWQADGVDIPGETGASLSPRNLFTLSQSVLTCVITANNGTTQASVATQGVTLPEINPPGPFVADFATGDVSAGFIPSSAATIAYSSASGALQVTANGAWQGVNTPVLDVVPGQTYQIDVDMENTASGALDVIVGTSANAENVLSDSGRLNSGTTGRITATVTAPGETLVVHPRLRGNANGAVFHVIRVAVTPL